MFLEPVSDRFVVDFHDSPGQHDGQEYYTDVDCDMHPYRCIGMVSHPAPFRMES